MVPVVGEMHFRQITIGDLQSPSLSGPKQRSDANLKLGAHFFTMLECLAYVFFFWGFYICIESKSKSGIGHITIDLRLRVPSINPKRWQIRCGGHS
jgi:hypothetical protein